MDKSELIKKLVNGEELAYKSIFEDYYAVMVVFANKYLNNIEMAKEIAQIVFVKLYEKRNSIKIKVSIKSYLYKMVYNSCLNYFKSQQIQNIHIEKYSKEIDVFTEYIDFIEQSENELRLFKAIEKLPPGCKSILLQSRIDGKKNKEIAEEHQISIRTVETQISKALKLVKEGLSL